MPALLILQLWKIVHSYLIHHVSHNGWIDIVPAQLRACVLSIMAELPTPWWDSQLGTLFSSQEEGDSRVT